MKVSRRDLLIGTAGVTVGLVFTPVPWKLLGDVSIWTQNFPWIPQPPHGPIETKQSLCTLCANGCPLRVRMAAGWPVGISGVPANPLTKGALCPLGFAAHQLNWDPRRLREVCHHGHAASWAVARAAFEKACSEGPVGILDGRPGRAASAILASFAAKHKCSYQLALGPESRALAPYADWSGVPATALGYDLENVRTVVSFGAPLLDGWGTPGRFTRMWSERAAGISDPQLRLIQIEPKLSQTGARAWRWVPVREGCASALAAGLGRVMLEENLVAAKGPVPPMTLAEASTQCGLSAEEIRELARTMLEHRPALVITPDANPAVAVLNILLGAVGTPGGIVLRTKTREPQTTPKDAPDSLRALLVDSTVPWEFVPQTSAEVFRFAAWEGGGNKADWFLPTPGFLEEPTDVPTAPTSSIETYAIAVNLLTPSDDLKTPAGFLAQIDPSLPAIDQAIHARCQQIFKARIGTVCGEHRVPVTAFESASKLEEELRKGSVWLGEPVRAASFKRTLKEWPADSRSSRPMDWSDSWAPPVLPVLATKLYQESHLRAAPARSKA